MTTEKFPQAPRGDRDPVVGFYVFHGRRRSPENVHHLGRTEEVETHLVLAFRPLCNVQQCRDEGMVGGFHLVDVRFSQGGHHLAVIYDDAALSGCDDEFACVLYFIRRGLQLMEKQAGILILPFNDGTELSFEEFS